MNKLALAVLLSASSCVKLNLKSNEKSGKGVNVVIIDVIKQNGMFISKHVKESNLKNQGSKKR